jgi:hypothetical protein
MVLPAYQKTQDCRISLFCLAVRLMFAAIRTEFFQLQTFGRRTFVFSFAVVPIFALGALELNNFARHMAPVPFSL